MNNIIYTAHPSTVMTLDAGGSGFVFSAIRGGEELTAPVILPAEVADLSRCLQILTEGFRTVRASLPEPPAAISFAFPGPADYAAGVIGDLPNFPAFRGGVALGAFLEERFGLPVFINNDGNLFAYGEALAGALPDINRRLKEAGNPKQYRNLLGVTLGTGFGAGVVIDGKLLTGDNGAGGDVWCLRNRKYPQYIVEESVSIRAVKRVYAELSGDGTARSPKDVFRIAEGILPGNREAAVRSFAELGQMAGDALAAAVTIVDAPIVIGGGLSGAGKYILPALLAEMNSHTGMMDGSRFGRLQMKVFNLDDEAELHRFTSRHTAQAVIPGAGRTVPYDGLKRIGVTICRRDTSRSIAMGAYLYALNHLT
ncbi:MAG: ROK family protein [Tannerellaceae bacterium]|jgi:glucokinase|nr:ROK family protein [Tannerellaceae bacterium]